MALIVSRFSISEQSCDLWWIEIDATMLEMELSHFERPRVLDFT
jgi:hypothetical protein